MGKQKENLIIITISSCVLASVMSTSMLTIAFPDLVNYFNISFSTLQIRNVLFFTFFATLLPLFGKFADIYGGRKLLISGLILFLSATFLSAITNNWYLFLVFQIIQAIADSMIVPAQVLLIRQCFKDEKIGWAFGWFSGILAGATLIGPGLGGVILRLYNWQMIYFVLFIVSLISLALVLSVIPKGKDINKKSSKVPINNCITLLVFVLSLQFVFHTGLSFFTRLVISILCILSISFFIYYEKKNIDGSALFPKKAIKNPIFISSLFRIFVLFVVTNTILLYIPSYMRDVHGLSPDLVGFIVMMDSILATLLAGYAGRLSDKKDNRTLILIAIFISMLGMLSLYSTSIISNLSLFIIAFLLFGLAGVISMPSQNKIAMLAVPKEETGVYMGLFQMVQFGTGAFAAGVFNTFFSFNHFTIKGFTLLIVSCFILYLIAMLSIAFDRRTLKKNTSKTSIQSET